MEHGILKVIIPAYWGDTCSIIGNRKGLEQLKNVIESALADGKMAVTNSFYETDGSNYVLICRLSGIRFLVLSINEYDSLYIIIFLI